MATSIDGVTIAVARKINKFAFGAYYIRTEIDHEESKYKIYLHKEINSERLPEAVLEDFKGYWGRNWVVEFLSKEEIKKFSIKNDL